MYKGLRIKPPFFEIGPKNYLYGKQVLELAKASDIASKKNDVSVIFTTPYSDIRMVAEETDNLFIFAPHMDPLAIGRGLADILPESIKAAGAVGVLLNHAEKPLSFSVLRQSIKRADEVGLVTVACADSIVEAKAIALLEPNIIIAEPTELIGTSQTSDIIYASDAIDAVKSVNPEIMVLVGAGISCGQDAYKMIFAGCEATGSTSGIIKAKDSIAMIDEMLSAVRNAWDTLHFN